MNYKEKINKKGLKITWLADQIGIAQPLLSMYLHGARTMPESVELKLAKLLL